MTTDLFFKLHFRMKYSGILRVRNRNDTNNTKLSVIFCKDNVNELMEMSLLTVFSDGICPHIFIFFAPV